MNNPSKERRPLIVCTSDDCGGMFGGAMNFAA